MGEQFEIRSVPAEDLLQRPVRFLKKEDLEPVSGTQAVELLRAAGLLSRKVIVGDVILGREDLGFALEAELPEGDKLIDPALAGQVEFLRSAFPERLQIQDCVFEGRFNGAGVSFARRVLAERCHFLGELDFSFSSFDEPVSFSGCRFDGRVSFSDATFVSRGSFRKAVFADAADFFNSDFQGGASFAGSRFEKRVNCAASRFVAEHSLTASLDLSRVACAGPAIFRRARFEGLADLEAAHCRGIADFSGAQFEYLRLDQAMFDWLEVSWEQIGGRRLIVGRVRFEGPDAPPPRLTKDDMDEFFVRRVDASLDAKHRQYDILKNLFLRQGDFVSADGCFYEWKQVERRESQLGWSPESWIVKGFHTLNWLSCGYGVRPLRTLLFAAAIVAGFALLYSFILPAAGAQAVSVDLGSLPLRLAELPRFLELSFLSFMNFPFAEPGLGRIGELALLVERLLGWFTLLLFVTTYTRIMLR